jgi:hypothetical protein
MSEENPIEKYLNLKIEALDKIINTRLEAQDKALELQAKKYDEHLASLNHEAAQLKEMQATYLPRETYDIQYSELKTYKDRMDGKASSLSVLISYIFTLAVLILAIIDLVME